MHGATLKSGISGNKVNTPTYGGQLSFETYRLQFEAVRSKANNWSEVEKAVALVVALRRQALYPLRTIPTAEKGDSSKLYGALEIYFGELRHR